MMPDEPADYSEVADQQLDALEASDPDLSNDMLTICELVFRSPGRAQAMSSAIHTPGGVVLRIAVPGRFPSRVFWTSEGPRIEAVFDHP